MASDEDFSWLLEEACIAIPSEDGEVLDLYRLDLPNWPPERGDTAFTTAHCRLSWGEPPPGPDPMFRRLLFNGEDIETELFMAFAGLFDLVDEEFGKGHPWVFFPDPE